MDDRNRQEDAAGEGRKDRINKEPTSAVERPEEEAFDVAGNVRFRAEDPSPDDRARGERSGAAPAGAADSGRR
jgi:hypothetical protein